MGTEWLCWWECSEVCLDEDVCWVGGGEGVRSVHGASSRVHGNNSHGDVLY